NGERQSWKNNQKRPGKEVGPTKEKPAGGT
ncbi:Clp protease ClpE, partial [Erwinia amylovora]